jgi:hypothetical protein
MKRLVVLGCLAGVFAGCNPDIPNTPPSTYVVALFDPSNSVVPTPNLLAMDPRTGLLAVPLAPDASPAQAEFVAFLNSLDGFPEDTPGKALFDSELDPSTVNLNNLRVFDLVARAPIVGATVAYTATPGGSLAKSQISILPPPSGWPASNIVGVALVGGSAGLKGTGGAQVVGSVVWGLVRSKTPLVSCMALTLPDGSLNPDCQPNVSVIPSSEHDSAARLQDQTRTAFQLEQLRKQYVGFLDILESQGIARDSVPLAWTFKVTSRPQLTFDPARNIIPFPNDILRTTVLADGGRRVSLPIPDAGTLPDGGVPDIVQLYGGLNTLDGFSTTAPIVSVFNADNLGALNQGRIDAGSLTPGAGWGFLRLGGTPAHPATAPSVTVCLDCASSPLTDGGTNPQRLQFVPMVPLDERTQYGVYLTTNVTDGQGRKAIPSSAFALLRSANPLFDGSKSTVDLISDAQAQQLEPLRAALKPFVDGVANSIGGRSNLALAWAFTTQSEVTTLQQLRLVPQALPAPTANPLFMQEVSSFCSGFTHVSHCVVGEITVAVLLTGPGGVFNPDAPSIRKIPFLLTLPSVPAPPASYPITIFGHGLSGARTNMLAIADRLAQGGQATIATDVVWHGERSSCTGSRAVLGAAPSDDYACADPTTQACDAASGRCILKNRSSGSLTACTFGNPLSDQVCLNVGQGFCFSDNKCEGGDYLRDSMTTVPRISGWNILNLTNLFATRDNFRQQVVDLSQLTRVLEGGGSGNFNAQLASVIAVPGTSIDATRINYAGQSLGGILGTLYTSVAPDVHNVVLNVPGADPGSILLLSPSFSAQRTAFLRTLAGQGIAPGSIAFDTFIGIAKWILDPADPQNMAFSVMNGVVGTARPADRKALVQYITLDEVIPNVTTTELISAGNRTGIGAAQLDTFLFNPSTVAYPPSCSPQGVCDPTIPSRHGFLLRSPDAPTIQTAQCQVANYVDTGAIGTCP